MTLRLGIAFCTTHIPAQDHGFTSIKAVRYAPSTSFAELSRPDITPAWQTPALSWTQDANCDLQLGPRPFEQALIEIDGETD